MAETTVGKDKQPFSPHAFHVMPVTKWLQETHQPGMALGTELGFKSWYSQRHLLFLAVMHDIKMFWTIPRLQPLIGPSIFGGDSNSDLFLGSGR